MKQITIPRMCKELAEEIGIHIGDGSMYVNPGIGHYDYTVCGSIDDYSYLMGFVEPLIKNLYGLSPNKPTKKKGRSFDLVYCSKELVSWKKKIGLLAGPKNDIMIPNLILESPFVLDCIRGIFDTDGSIVFNKKHGGQCGSVE